MSGQSGVAVMDVTVGLSEGFFSKFNTEIEYILKTFAYSCHTHISTRYLHSYLA